MNDADCICTEQGLSYPARYDDCFYGVKVASLSATGWRALLHLADVYEETSEKLHAQGVETECTGGGRIDHNKEKKMILVYGYSMVQGFTVNWICV